MQQLPPSEPELASVLTALAGVRKGEVVVVLGPGRITRAALAAGCGRDLLDPEAAPRHSAAVVVVTQAAGDAVALSLLRPGGRFVALAEGEAQARSAADLAGLALRCVVPVGPQVAWSAQAPLGRAG